MELIFTDENRDDVGVLINANLDMAIGEDENNFQLTLNSDDFVLHGKSFIYVENTEYGGIIDKANETSNNEDIVYEGRTWQGILEKKIIKPLTGNDYYIVNGEANMVLNSIIDYLELDTIFKASKVNSGITIKNYQFPRYINGYKGINKMLRSYGAKLKFKYTAGYVELSAVFLIDYSQDEEWDKNQLTITATKKYLDTNHLVCLGQGELSQRTVVDLYVDDKGEISKTQHFFGYEEITEVYENVNCESVETLTEEGINKLEDIISEGEIGTDFDNEKDIYDIGDIVGSRLELIDQSVSEYITKKILKINGDDITVECEVG